MQAYTYTYIHDDVGVSQCVHLKEALHIIHMIMHIYTHNIYILHIYILHIYIYIYILHVYIYIYTYMYMHIQTWYVCMCVCCTHTHVGDHAGLSNGAHIKEVHTHIHTHTCIHIHTYEHACIHTYIPNFERWCQKQKKGSGAFVPAASGSSVAKAP
jgi:hypothetical protein